MKKSTLIILLLIGAKIIGFSQEKSDTTKVKEKKVHNVIFPSYDYRPVLEHSAAIFNKNIVNLKDNNLFISDALAVKSLSNESLILRLTNELYLNKWRFYLTGSYVKMVNKMAASEIGLPMDNQFGISNNMWNVQGFAKRRVGKGIYLGLGYEILDVTSTLEFSDLQVPGMEDMEMKTVLSQPEFIIEFDSRNDVIYPTKGFFITTQSNLISDAFGSKIENMTPEGIVETEDYFYTRNYVKAHYYKSLSGDWRSVLASRVSMRVATGDLPVGLWENANNFIRGYKEGNYTGKQLYYLDLEWRKYVTNRIGFVLFGTAGFIGEDMSHAFTSDRFVPAGGTGLRLQLSKSKKVAFRVDYAVGRGGENSVYFGLSEYF